MKKKRKTSAGFFLILLLIIGGIYAKEVLQLIAEKQTAEPIVEDDPFANVKKYAGEISTELEKYGLEDYTETLIALMQQESAGTGGDPMQASESAGLEPNTIHDPSESIHYGVRYFKEVLEYGQIKKVDFSTVIQSYNMGKGYIDYIAEKGGEHTEKLAKQFSMKQVKKNPELYNCGGNKDNFRYPYCYGDFTYSEKVNENIEVLAESNGKIVSYE